MNVAVVNTSVLTDIATTRVKLSLTRLTTKSRVEVGQIGNGVQSWLWNATTDHYRLLLTGNGWQKKLWRQEQ